MYPAFEYDSVKFCKSSVDYTSNENWKQNCAWIFWRPNYLHMAKQK